MIVIKDLRTELLERLKTEELVVIPASEAEYLELAHDFPYKTQYHNSEIYAMNLATSKHEMITGMLITILNMLYMNDDSYSILGSNAGIQIPKFEGGYYMPDVTLVKGELVFKENSACIITNPYVIIEVLSKSTSKFDTESKLPEYKALESVKQVIFVQQNSIGISSFVRSEQRNVWINHELTELNQEFEIDGNTVSVASIYKKVKP